MATLAPALRNLFKEIDTRWPRRARDVDGWYRQWYPGARPSDHHPDSRGIVHAIDITSAGILPGTVLALTAREAVPVAYVIWNRRIYSRIRRFSGIAYTGPHPHTNHLHVSLLYGTANENWSGRWGIANVTPVATQGVGVFGPADNWQYAHLIDGSAGHFPILNSGLIYQAGVVNRMRT